MRQEAEVHVDIPWESFSEDKITRGLPQSSCYKAESTAEIVEVKQYSGDVENTTQPSWRGHINTIFNTSGIQLRHQKKSHLRGKDHTLE